MSKIVALPLAPCATTCPQVAGRDSFVMGLAYSRGLAQLSDQKAGSAIELYCTPRLTTEFSYFGEFLEDSTDKAPLEREIAPEYLGHAGINPASDNNGAENGGFHMNEMVFH